LAAGVPLIAPVELFIVSPAGKLTVPLDHVYVPVPPVTLAKDTGPKATPTVAAAMGSWLVTVSAA
jgi:hypothetical protein